MIIYKYQYEKECMLKKMHCYWCLNNCTVREMERGRKNGNNIFCWKGVAGTAQSNTHTLTHTLPSKVRRGVGAKGEIKKKINKKISRPSVRPDKSTKQTINRNSVFLRDTLSGATTLPWNKGLKKRQYEWRCNFIDTKKRLGVSCLQSTTFFLFSFLFFLPDCLCVF